jgi:hypothetical protein
MGVGSSIRIFNINQLYHVTATNASFRGLYSGSIYNKNSYLYQHVDKESGVRPAASWQRGGLGADEARFDAREERLAGERSEG